MRKNKYVAFQNTFVPQTQLFFFPTREDAMKHKIHEEDRNSDMTWTVTKLDPRTPNRLRRLWMWCEAKLEQDI